MYLRDPPEARTRIFVCKRPVASARAVSALRSTPRTVRQDLRYGILSSQGLEGRLHEALERRRIDEAESPRPKLRLPAISKPDDRTMDGLKALVQNRGKSVDGSASIRPASRPRAHLPQSRVRGVFQRHLRPVLRVGKVCLP